MKTKWEFNAAINECLQRLGWNHFLHHFCADIGIQCTGLLDSRWVWIQQFQKVFKSLCIYINRIAAQLQQKISYSPCFFSGWFFLINELFFKIDHSSGTCLVHKKCIGHVLKISIHSFCLWTRQCLEVVKSLSNIHLENMSCVNNRCQTMKLLAWLHHVCVCVHRTSTNSNALICFSLCDPAQGNARIMKCWNMFEACFGWSQKRIQTVQDTNKFQQLCFLQLSPDSRTDVLLPIHAELYFNLSSTDTARGIVRYSYTGYNVFSFSLTTNT